MKTTRKIFMLGLMTIALMSISCTKEGPAGPMGAIGPEGPSGTQGIAGQDGVNGTDGVNGVNGADGADATFNPIFFKVRGNGFAIKDLDGGDQVETDIWEIVEFDTANAFNMTTKRFVAPETGYYFLQVYIRQSNRVTDAFFRLHFNVDSNSRHNQIVDGDDVKIHVSGIYRLTEGQEVYANLRNFSAGIDVKMDGTGSWFEGYKIN